MGKGSDPPPPRDYAAETDATLKAQVANAPAVYESEAKFSPLYAQLGLKEMETSLLGAGGQRGLLDIYEKDLYPAMSRIGSQSEATQRESDIAAIERYGPRATAALRASNPEAQALLDKLTGQANSQLDADGRLDPSMQREAQQYIRQAQASRGMGFGNADVFQEALGVGGVAENRRAQNQRLAMDVYGLQRQSSADPFMAILGRPSSSMQAGAGTAGQAFGVSQNAPSLFNPESAYAQDVYDTNYNAANARYLNSQNFWGGVLGGTLGAVGQIGGGFMGRRR